MGIEDRIRLRSGNIDRGRRRGIRRIRNGVIGAVARVGTQRLLVAERCDIFGKELVAPSRGPGRGTDWGGAIRLR